MNSKISYKKWGSAAADLLKNTKVQSVKGCILYIFFFSFFSFNRHLYNRGVIVLRIFFKYNYNFINSPTAT